LVLNELKAPIRLELFTIDCKTGNTTIEEIGFFNFFGGATVTMRGRDI
jgi:hypothetical protein